MYIRHREDNATAVVWTMIVDPFRRVWSFHLTLLDVALELKLARRDPPAAGIKAPHPARSAIGILAEISQPRVKCFLQFRVPHTGGQRMFLYYKYVLHPACCCLLHEVVV